MQARPRGCYKLKYLGPRCNTSRTLVGSFLQLNDCPIRKEEKADSGWKNPEQETIFGILACINTEDMPLYETVCPRSGSLKTAISNFDIICKGANTGCCGF